MTQQDPQLMLLSPRSEIRSLRKVIETKDACLHNFSKTLRAADEQTKRAEELLKKVISSKKDDGSEHRDVEVFLLQEELRAQSVKYAALLVKHEKFVCIAREEEEALKEEVRRLAMQFSENTRPSPGGFIQSVKSPAEVQSALDQARHEYASSQEETKKLRGKVEVMELQLLQNSQTKTRDHSHIQSLQQEKQHVQTKLDQVEEKLRRMVCQVQLSQAESRANAFEFESKIEALNHQLGKRERLRVEAEEGRSKAEIKRVATEKFLSRVRRDLSQAKNVITQLQVRLEQYEKQMEEMQHRLRISEEAAAEAVVQEHQHASVVSKVHRHVVRTSPPPQRSSPPPVELEIRVKQQTPEMSLDADFTSSPSVGTWPKSSRPLGVFSDYSPFVADASAATEQMSLARLKECLRELAENLHQTQSTLEESERERVELLRQVDRKDQQIQELLAESFRNNLHLSGPHASRSQTHAHTHTLSPFPRVVQMPPADFTQHTSQNIGDPITPRKIEILNTSPRRDSLKNALQIHRNQQYTCMEERDDLYTSLEDGDLSKESTFSASSVQSLPGPALVAVPAQSSASMLSTPSWTDLPCLYSCSMGSARNPPSNLDVEGCIGPDNDNTSVSALSKQSTLASLTPTPTSDGGYFHGNFEGGHTQGVLTVPGKKDWYPVIIESRIGEPIGFNLLERSH